jgi:hypothetical protein
LFGRALGTALVPPVVAAVFERTAVLALRTALVPLVVAAVFERAAVPALWTALVPQAAAAVRRVAFVSPVVAAGSAWALVPALV